MKSPTSNSCYNLGISILVNDVHSKNAPYEVTRLPLSFTQSPVIEVNREPFSKVTFTNPVHLRKILSPIVSTLEGISIAVYFEFPIAFRFEFFSKVITVRE